MELAILGIWLLGGFVAIVYGSIKAGKEYQRNMAELHRKEEEQIAKMTPQELERYNQLNKRVAYGLPLKCPRCEKEAKWKSVDSTKKHEFDSAVTIGAYTQINVKEKEVVRFICSECGFELNKSRIF